MELHNVVPVSASTRAEVVSMVRRALTRFTDADLDGDGPLAIIANKDDTVTPTRVTKKKIVFICHRNGKLVGSAMVVAGS